MTYIILTPQKVESGVSFENATTIILYGFQTVPESLGQAHAHVVNLIIGPNTKAIGADAFSECPELVSIYLPKGLEEIGPEAFSCNPCLGRINIPAGMLRIGFEAFSFSGLQEVSFSHYCNPTVDVCAFQGCTQLTSIVGVQHINKVMSGAFGDCPNLKVDFRNLVGVKTSLGAFGFL